MRRINEGENFVAGAKKLIKTLALTNELARAQDTYVHRQRGRRQRRRRREKEISSFLFADRSRSRKGDGPNERAHK